jgi:hypothetical protein
MGDFKKERLFHSALGKQSDVCHEISDGPKDGSAIEAGLCVIELLLADQIVFDKQFETFKTYILVVLKADPIYKRTDCFLTRPAPWALVSESTSENYGRSRLGTRKS